MANELNVRYRHPEGPVIEVVPDEATFDSRAADMVADAVAGGATAIALPTGSTPKELYRLMSERARAGDLSLDRVTIYQLDEFRNLGEGDPNSFAVWLREQVLDAADVGPDRFVLVPATADDPDAAGQAFEARIAAAGGLDLVVLGLGDNGHVAFNEPGSGADSRTRRLTLTDVTVEQTARTWPAGSPVPTEAVTMGIATLLDARAALLLVKGVAKAGIVRQTLIEDPTDDVPGSHTRRAGERLTVLLDSAAASGIAEELSRWERLG